MRILPIPIPTRPIVLPVMKISIDPAIMADVRYQQIKIVESQDVIESAVVVSDSE
jgi:hypothetical protein